MKGTELPASWRMTTLGGVSRAKPNNGLFRKNPEYLTDSLGGLPVIWLEELFRGTSIDAKHSRRVAATEAEVGKYGLKNGDILFCRSSLKLDGIAFSNVYLGEDDAALFECHLIRFSPNLEEVLPVFLNWVLRSPRIRALAKSKSKTATMTTIDQEGLASIPLPLPPLAEQRRIAKMLDKTEALRAKRRAALTQLDSLTQSIFLDLFGDPISNPRKLPQEYLETFFHFRTGKLDSNAAVASGQYPFFTCARENFRIDAFAFDCEALLLAGNNASADYTVKLYKGKFNAYQRTYVITLRDEGNSYDYSRFVLEHRLAELKRISKGTNTKYLTMELLNKIQIPVPPKTAQHEFARQVAQVEKLKATHRTSLTELDALFATLQHRAFRGEL